MSTAVSSSEEVSRYSAGFLFQAQGTIDRVLLVEKTRPTWQVGLLNAVGGKFDGPEEATVCMVREFNEEVGLALTTWEFFCTEFGPGYEVHFFRARLHRDMKWRPPKTNDVGEKLAWYNTDRATQALIGNLHWLIPLALDPRRMHTIVRTEDDIRKIATW